MGFLNTIAKGTMAIARNSVKMIYDHKETGLLVAGVLAGTGATVLACRATIKAVDIIEEHNEINEMIKEAKNYPEQYSEEDEKQDKVKNYLNTGKKIALAYAPAAALGATSIFCLVAQHKLLLNKVTTLEETVASLSAAYAAIDTAFRNYRKRVVDKYGEEEDRYFRYGERKETVEVTTVDEKGKTKKKKETVTVVDNISNEDVSGYAKFFTYDNPNMIFKDAQHHEVDWDRTLRWLKCQESLANQILENQGYIFLNDIYDMIGFKKTKAGQVVGNRFDPEDPTIDSHISFGLYKPINYRTINGYEQEGIWIDVNVDGVIIDKIDSFGDH